MACILKLPESTKGALVFTSPEIDYIKNNSYIDSNSLAERFVIGIHYNWQPIVSPPPDYIDFLFADSDDFETDIERKLILGIDACNFPPKDFSVTKQKKYWDSISIFRNVEFKNFEIGLMVIRKIYDRLNNFNAKSASLPNFLFVVSSPSENWRVNARSKKISNLYKILFSLEERKHFQLINIFDNYPFPFKSNQLSLFFNAANSFMTFSQNEFRSRMVGYAIAAGLPVFGFSPTSRLFPKEFRANPFFYTCSNLNDFADNFINYKPSIYSNSDLQSKFNSRIQSIKLKQTLSHSFGLNQTKKLWFLDSLDIRLGRHHIFASNKASHNHLPLDLVQFIRKIVKISPDFSFDRTNGSDIESFLAY